MASSAAPGRPARSARSPSLQLLDRLRIGRRAPSLRDADRLKAAAALAMAPKELGGELQRQLVPLLPAASRSAPVAHRIRRPGSRGRPRARRRSPVVLVEVDHLIDAVRRLRLVDVAERTAVADRLDPRPVDLHRVERTRGRRRDRSAGAAGRCSGPRRRSDRSSPLRRGALVWRRVEGPRARTDRRAGGPGAASAPRSRSRSSDRSDPGCRERRTSRGRRSSVGLRGCRRARSRTSRLRIRESRDRARVARPSGGAVRGEFALEADEATARSAAPRAVPTDDRAQAGDSCEP